MEYSLRARRIGSGRIWGQGIHEKTCKWHTQTFGLPHTLRVSVVSKLGTPGEGVFLQHPVCLHSSSFPVVLSALEELACFPAPPHVLSAQLFLLILLAPMSSPSIPLLVSRKQSVLQEVAVLFSGLPLKPLISLLGKHGV